MTDDGIKEILDQVTSGWLLDEDDDHAHPHAIRHLVAAVEAAERERLCAAIKAADDKASESDYMLDSDDCISVIRGTWNPGA